MFAACILNKEVCSWSHTADNPAPLPQPTQVESYYFHHYMAHWNHPVIGNVYRRVPQIMTWDGEEAQPYIHPAANGFGRIEMARH
jgi:hypothetical protein